MALFLAGGFPMIFVLVFGLISIGASARFAWHPDSGRLGHLIALSLSVVFASITGFCVDMMVVTQHAPEMAEAGQLGTIVLVGLGESLSPLILGFSLVSISALIAAVGLRRMPSA